MIIHVLKDGSRVEDITGHVVRLDDSDPLYNLIDSINQGIQKKTVHKSRLDKEVLYE